MLLAEDWGPPSGVLHVHWWTPLLSAAPAALISTLLVAPDRRRVGVARLLLKSACRAARAAGCDDVTMIVSAEQGTFAASR